MLYPLSYRGTCLEGDVSMYTTPPVNLRSIPRKKKEIADGAISSFRIKVCLRCLGLFLRLSKNATAIKCVVDDFPYSRSIRVYVHSITSTQMTQNALCRYLPG